MTTIPWVPVILVVLAGVLLTGLAAYAVAVLPDVLRRHRPVVDADEPAELTRTRETADHVKAA